MRRKFGQRKSFIFSMDKIIECIHVTLVDADQNSTPYGVRSTSQPLRMHVCPSWAIRGMDPAWYCIECYILSNKNPGVHRARDTEEKERENSQY